MTKIEVGGWDYLEKMANKYQADITNLLVSINVCPSCDSKLTRERIEGKTITRCHTCNKAWEIVTN